MNWRKYPKLTPQQREEIVTIALFQRGQYNAYPMVYIAALYGVSHVYVSHLITRSGKYRKGTNATKSVSCMGLRRDTFGPKSSSRELT